MNHEKIITILRQLFLFGLVGGVGFIVDAGILYLLKSHFGLYLARIVSFIAAVLTTWLLNRTITFKQNKSNFLKLKEFMIYFAYMLLGGAVNLLMYFVLIQQFILMNEYPIIAVAIGSIAGMMVNFLTSKFLLFKS